MFLHSPSHRQSLRGIRGGFAVDCLAAMGEPDFIITSREVSKNPDPPGSRIGSW